MYPHSLVKPTKVRFRKYWTKLIDQKNTTIEKLKIN